MNPPSALRGLRCDRIALPDYEFDGHLAGSNAIFSVACPCGSRLFTASGWVAEDGEIGPPVSLTCDACEAGYDVFDPSLHGFDALQRDELEEPDIGAANYPDDYPDPEPPYEIIVRFEFTLEEPRGIDRFSWITVLAKTRSGELAPLLDWECA